MPISSILNRPINSLVKKTGPAFNRFAEFGWIQKRLNEGITDPARFTAKMMLLSIVSKDLVNCGLYTYQSWNNEKIPESKRKFVAAVDAMNGVVMVLGQLFAGYAIDKTFTPWIKSKFTGTIKDAKNNDINKIGDKKATTRIFHNDNIKAFVYNTMKKLGIDEKAADVNIEKIIKSVSKKTKEPFIAGLGIVVTTLATTAIVKRMMAPLISTPAAGYINDKFLKTKGDAKKDNRLEYEWSALVATSRYEHPEDKVTLSKTSSANK